MASASTDSPRPEPESLIERAFHQALGQPDNNDRTRTRLLDAAYEQFCRMGIQRSSMEDVARRAGLSRITVYRRFATKDELVEQVILREFRRYFDRFLVEIQTAESAADRVVLGFVSSHRAIRDNPMIGGLIWAEPNLIAGSMIGDDGQMLATVRQFLAAQLRQEQRVGNVAKHLNIDLVAEMMVRVSASFLAIPSHVVDLDSDEELSALAWQFLVPMLDPPATPT